VRLHLGVNSECLGVWHAFTVPKPL
jgi:hypothetical protein